MRQRDLNILAFAYVFPPDAGSGTYRTLYFANHWEKQGDHVTVITVKEECLLSTASVDRSLCNEIHPAICVVRASARRPLQKLLGVKSTFRRKTSTNEHPGSGRRSSQPKNSTTHSILRPIKDTLTDLLSCPDEHIGWVPDAVRAGYRIAKATRIDCIYATGGPWSCLLAGAILSRLYGIPLVLDFRDPWVSNPNLNGKSVLSRWLQRKMESMCVSSSKIVIANTEELKQDFVSRYVSMDPSRFVTITNGFEDLPEEVNCSAEQFILVHAGALYQPRNPLNFLRAVIELVKAGVIPAKTFRIQLIGGVSIEDPAVESELRCEVLRDVLEVIPRVSHGDALALQRRASGLLLIQTGFPLQVPRKLYEYLSLARPILTITEPHSATARTVNELRLGYVAADDIASIKRAIVALYEQWKSGEPLSIDQQSLQAYDNRYLSARVREIMLGISHRS